MKKLLPTLLCLSVAGGSQVFAQDYQYAPNSYIFDTNVSHQNNYGGLLLPVKKAYTMWANNTFLKSTIPPGIATPVLIWEDNPGMIGALELQQAAAPEESKIKVNINKGRGKGNAVIGYAVDGTVYWSWHVWVTDDPSAGVDYSQGIELDKNNKPFTVHYMDRNLGAGSADFLGKDWHKSGGLMYQWGRKDPFPPLVYKDHSFYEINSQNGYLKHKTISNQTLPVVLRPSAAINDNIQYATKNPLHFIINSDGGNWFSSQLWKTSGSGNTFETWDLWSDNRRGLDSNASSSNSTLATDSRSYELKSPFDPCPDGWRVPSHYGRVTMNNNHSPWGRKNSGGNDDINPTNRDILPTATNPALDGVRVYPGIGIDFTNAGGGVRNIGKMPTTGRYVYYPNSVAPNAPISSLYQDEMADADLWTSTFGYDGARFFMIISDPLRTNTAVGLHSVYINQTSTTKSGNAVRCMRDPNIAFTGTFPTEYYTAPKENFTAGMDNPNTYLITGDMTSVQIPVNKAFAVYNQLLSEQDMLPADNLVAKVYWTTNPAMISSLQISGSGTSATIQVQLKEGQRGNAVISLHNGSTNSPAYWSWLLWAPYGDPTLSPAKYLTEQPLATNANFVNATKSAYPPLLTTLMDRNIGALNRFDDSTDTEFLESTKGLLFQWGRKDPIPQFSGIPTGNTTLEHVIYLGNENATQTGSLSFTKIEEAYYQNTLAKSFADYANTTLQKSDQVIQNVLYAVQYPLTFLYQSGSGSLYNGGVKSNNDLTQVRDWVSDERNKMPERWGHGTGKSVFDPCPAGWRVPDVSSTNLYTSSKGTSPFYNSYKDDGTGKPGVIQDLYYDIVTFYQGGIYPAGYKLRSQLYPLGNFPKEKIRGELGGSALTATRSGIWTASLADLSTGYALGLIFDGKKMASGTAAYPQSGMGVRCSKITNDNVLLEPVFYQNIPLDNPSMITPQLPIRTP